MRRQLAVLAGAALICAAAAAPASAQVIPTRPFPGLFGSGDPAKSVTQVDFVSFLAGGRDVATTSLDDGALGTSRSETGFGNLVLRGRLAHQGRRTRFGSYASGTTSYYSRAGGERTPFSFSGGATFSGSVGRYGSFALRQTVFYSPYYVVGAVSTETADGPEAETEVSPDADSSVDPRVDQRVTRLSTTGYASAASIGRRVGRDGSLFTSYRLHYVDYAERAPDLLAHAPRGGYRHRFSRYASFVASYGLTAYEYRHSGYGRLASHNIGLGLGYNRPLSAWRHTTVGFNVGTALIDDGRFTRAYLTGNGRIYRRFARTWIGGLTYLRAQQVLEGFVAPFFTFSDTIAGSFSGDLGRGVALSGRLAYSHSRFTFDELENTFDTLAATTRLRVPVVSMLSAYVEAYYAEHDFQRRLGLLQGIPASLERFGTRAGVTLSVPVYR
ncbi:MAG TPA: hypothetical protein VFK57_06255 [Vicinamibacterales bacterium]|nr:hypothetical protein [Vicinamibacterales bacterium]